MSGGHRRFHPWQPKYGTMRWAEWQRKNALKAERRAKRRLPQPEPGDEKQ